MKVFTKLVYQMDSTGGLTLQHEESFEYPDNAPVALCKGEGNALKEKDRANRIQDAEIARQNEIFDSIKKATSRYTEGSGEGFDPALKQNMISQFLNDNSRSFQNAGAGVRGAMAARGSGGSDAPAGGDFVRGVASLYGDRAANRSSGMANINMSDLQQALTNKFNAMSLQSGNAATLNSPIGTMGSMSSNAFNQYMQAKNSGFGASFMKSLGGGLGSGLASMATGGLGGFMGMKSGQQ